MKKVSIIIPAFNNSELTIKCLNSIFSQTYQNIEIIVVNDGSTDDTEYKLKAWLAFSFKVIGLSPLFVNFINLSRSS